MIVAAVVGYLVGLIALRRTGIYFAAGYPPAGDRSIGDGRQALPRRVIGDVEDTEASAAGELVVD